MTYQTQLVPETKIVILKCPAYRLMNTQDYNDIKFEIGLFYKLKGFYVVSQPDPNGGDPSMLYGNGEIAIIEILDSAVHIWSLFFLSAAGLLFI